MGRRARAEVQIRGEAIAGEGTRISTASQNHRRNDRAATKRAALVT
jgi:hypothetical protein